MGKRTKQEQIVKLGFAVNNIFIFLTRRQLYDLLLFCTFPNMKMENPNRKVDSNFTISVFCAMPGPHTQGGRHSGAGPPGLTHRAGGTRAQGRRASLATRRAAAGFRQHEDRAKVARRATLATGELLATR